MTPFSPTSEMTIGTRVLEHYLDTCGYLLSEAANGTPVDVEPEEPVRLRRGLRFLLRHGPDSGGDHCLHCLRHYEGTT